MTAPRLVVLELSALLATTQNPRTDGGVDLMGLAASMATEREPYLLNPPTVAPATSGTYRIIAGERRVRGAKLAGWTSVACLVQGSLDPIAAHTLRIVENLHRRDLHPLDAATALKIAWLAENAIALGATDAVRVALTCEMPSSHTLATLTRIAAEAGLVPTRPVITWEGLLGRLGLAIDRERLKKLLRVLSLEPDVIVAVRPLHLSEAALRALGTLQPQDQRRVAQALVEDGSLARRVRRVVRLVRQRGYPVAQALAEVRGKVYVGPDSDDNGEQRAAAPGKFAKDLDVEESSSLVREDVGQMDVDVESLDYADAVLRLVDLAEQFAAARAHLSALTHNVPPTALPHPWGTLVTEALAIAHLDPTF